VLEVMLHELCHNEFGPHSASFYKLLDELWDEFEALPENENPVPNVMSGNE
jgi:predicted metal-dependent hydrolase